MTPRIPLEPEVRAQPSRWWSLLALLFHLWVLSAAARDLVAVGRRLFGLH